ncbi:DUF805 domain-containing protein [Kingella kingae]|uniref:DUF805 domain-containing protein n=1 Tax=Kingella kingae TaxID=504 RepID=UPI0013DF15DD|nr:DUF805 domain-containing protein [Kingella kingae]MBD3614527.1 DUF805 domain-containing protein [Kingella kingae]MBD3632860.1 DUF805 domain-containing protein [Kingella kingae]MBD3660169.1 DUF805 domain-containing protein [Kingella kingae]MDK4585936.1 DUF805 domain-containing protein [Kingella kingae]MDK4603983.1 DUF805 domain-containing protein [Kingella kingae]
MKGQILNFSMENGGLITGNDGKRYQFPSQQWREQVMPERGMTVDFDINEQGDAVAIFLVEEIKNTVQQKTPAKPKPAAPKPTKDKSEYSLWDYAISVIKDNYANVNGRARRKEYWGFILFYNLILTGLQIIGLIGYAISNTVGAIFSIPFYLFALAALVPSVTAAVRRLHDVNKSGWWLLIAIIPVIGAIWLIVLLCQDGTAGENQFGHNPKEV